MIHVHYRDDAVPQLRQPCWWLLIYAGLAFGLVVAPASGADDFEQRYWAGLRARQLFRLAETYGQLQLRRNSLTDQERARLAIELAVTVTERAAQTSPPERAAVWELAITPLQDFLQDQPRSTYRPLVAMQMALVLVARGNLTRLELSATNPDTTQLENARSLLRTGLEKLAAVAQDVDQILADRALRPAADDPAAMTTTELESLRRNLDFQVGRARHSQALCYPSASADRDNALQLALTRFDRLAQQTMDDDLVWKSRAHTVAVLRELGQLETAASRLAEWLEQSAPAEAAVQLNAEWVRLLVARNQIGEAQQAARAALRTASAGRGDLDLAYLEAMVAAWQRAPQDERASATWTTRFTEHLATMRSRDRPLFVRQAETLVGRAVASDPTSDQPEVIELAAENLFHAGRYDEAIALYDQASVLSFRQGASAQGFQLGVTASAIDQLLKRHAQAASRLRRLALTAPQDDQAANIHHRAILSQSTAARSATTDGQTEMMGIYRELLAEHLANWPNAPTARDAQWWTIQLLLAERQWKAAATHLRTIPPLDDRYDEAVRKLIDCYARALAGSDGNTPPGGQDLLVRATRDLQPVITGTENRWPTRWTQLQLHAATVLADWHVRFGAAESSYAARLLEVAWPQARGLPSDDPDRLALMSLAVITGASGGPDSETVAQLSELVEQHPDDATIQEAYAQLLGQSDVRASLDQALSKWSEIESRSRRGGKRWLRARRARIDILTRRGDAQAAQKLRDLTELLYPAPAE